MCMMNKNIVGLSIGSALLWSFFVPEVGHAVQIESRQDSDKLIVAEVNGTTNALTTQLSKTSNLCNLRGKGRIRVPCGKPSQGSEQRTTDWSPYTNAIFTVMLTVILCTLIFLAAFSLALIVLASLSRRIPHQPLERASINLAWCGQGRQTS